MSDISGLEKIKKPLELPADAPDQNAEEESKEYKRKAPGAVEREIASHREHLDDLKNHISYHCEKIVCLEQRIVILDGNLGSEKQTCKDLSVRCAQHEAQGTAVTWMTAFGGVMIAGSSVAFGYGGCWPNVCESDRVLLSGIGIGTAVCGAALLIAAVTFKWWNLPKTTNPV